MNNELNTTQHNRVWDLLPWYVNETLSAEERSEVEAHLADCSSCRHELKIQKNLRQIVSESDIDQGRSNLAWAELERKIAPRPWFVHSPTPAIAASVLCCALGLVAYLYVPSEVFETLTSSYTVEEEQGFIMLRIRVAPGAQEADVLKILKAAGLREIGALSETGIITARASRQNDVSTLAEDLIRTDAIAYVAGDF